ncbi:hypothetical protein NNC19_16140 [Clostridium sp. SHJSY1]|uniref:hypothetical protein n=1 Tax=Clostridium sp. SHJSY1 TaxID=2942483 RepID=UPI0028744AE8|nr:hypothetical protein [Clostridium sp. SHJSY1]MDS0527223.1 hypothetical protein [Clostridium sp. SHJSY1]
MGSINKILRVLVYIILIAVMLFLVKNLFLYIIYGASLLDTITNYMGSLFISFLLILCVFTLNKKSKKRYVMILIIIGIFIMWRRYIAYAHLNVDSILVKSAIYDIIPLFLVYLSTICDYLVCRKLK